MPEREANFLFSKLHKLKSRYCRYLKSTRARELLSVIYELPNPIKRKFLGEDE